MINKLCARELRFWEVSVSGDFQGWFPVLSSLKYIVVKVSKSLTYLTCACLIYKYIFITELYLILLGKCFINQKAGENLETLQTPSEFNMSETLAQNQSSQLIFTIELLKPNIPNGILFKIKNTKNLFTFHVVTSKQTHILNKTVFTTDRRPITHNKSY